MAATVPVPTKSPGDVWTSSTWNTYAAANLNKLLNQGHRLLTVSAFNALTGLEDGDEVYLEVDVTNGIAWHLRYVAAEPTYKWRFLGGPPMFSEVATSEASAGVVYAGLATAGPSVTVPRAGDYEVTVGCTLVSSTAGAGIMSYDIGATGAVDADGTNFPATGTVSVARTRIKAALAASTLLAKYKNTSGASTISNRWLAIRPVRLI